MKPEYSTKNVKILLGNTEIIGFDKWSFDTDSPEIRVEENALSPFFSAIYRYHWFEAEVRCDDKNLCLEKLKQFAELNELPWTDDIDFREI